MDESVGAAGAPDPGGAPAPEDVESWFRLRQEPDNEVPVVVPVAAVLARTEVLAVVLTAVQACTTGFGLQVVTRVRGPVPADQDLFGQLANHHGSGGQFLLGVEFADGRRASVLGGDEPWPPRPATAGSAPGVSLVGTGGGGGGRRYEQGWWVSPLPPDGPLRVVVRWDAQGVEEGVTDLDGTAIAAAGRSALVLWPWEPEAPDPRATDGPPRPTTGWFAQP